MNPLFNMLIGSSAQMAAPQHPMTPVQRVGMIMQAMQNPAAFTKQQFPDIPDDIANDPGRILQYLQQTRQISNEQLSQIMKQFPRV